ncbi:hypothetical protein SDC9_07711 [bioreactor metagenome]|uniref:Peptidase S74 domain-containing protein n=1 Tax=bioreactor metagenome TaxID=1076179 RepID=A0A644T7C3_9ZZZZ
MVNNHSLEYASGVFTSTVNGITATTSLGSLTLPWGSLTGTLTNQTDLRDALDGKRNAFIVATTTTAASTAAKIVTTLDGAYIPTAGDVYLLSYTAGQTAASATLNINGSGAKNVRLQNANAAALGHTTAAGGVLMYYYDGTYYHLIGSQQQSDTNTTYTGWGFTPAAITVNTTGAINRMYIANSASELVLTLPTTAAIGSVIGITGLGTGGFRVAAPAGDNILIEGNNTGAAGYITGGQFDTVYLMNTVANTTWQVVDYTGTLADNNSITYGVSTKLKYFAEPSATPSVAPSVASGITGSIAIGDSAQANAINVNAMGTGAGNGTSANASSSNFFGYGSGMGATNAYHSNYFGSGAGYYATNAFYSNFFGINAGYNASSAESSNFFGRRAGDAATNAANSNFFGYYSGRGATNASFSNLFGFQSGMTFTGNNLGSNNIIIGTNISLPNATANSMNIGGLLFGTGLQSDTTGDPKIIPTSGSKLGIGTSTPAYKLTVQDTANPLQLVGIQTGTLSDQVLTVDAGGVVRQIPTSSLGGGGGTTLNWYAENVTAPTTAPISTGTGSIAMGNGAQALSSNMFVYGQNAGSSASSASYSSLLGFQSGMSFAGNNIGANNIIIGTNISLPNATANSMNIGGVLFGTGFYSTTSGNPLTTPIAGGKIGIGTNTPGYRLTVQDTADPLQLVGLQTAAPTDMLLMVNESTGVVRRMYSGTLLTMTDPRYIMNQTASDQSASFRIDGSGYIGASLGIRVIPTYTLDVGNSSVSGIVARFTNSTGNCTINPNNTSLSCSSDINLKKNIELLNTAETFTLTTVSLDPSGTSTLDKLSKLEVVKYNWNSENDGDAKHTGFIAQNMEQIFPDLVSTDPVSNLKAINYAGMTPYLVSAVNELNSKSIFANTGSFNLINNTIRTSLNNLSLNLASFSSGSEEQTNLLTDLETLFSTSSLASIKALTNTLTKSSFSLNMNNNALTNIKALESASGNWRITESGTLEVEKLCIKNSAGKYICITGDDLERLSIGLTAPTPEKPSNVDNLTTETEASTPSSQSSTSTSSPVIEEVTASSSDTLVEPDTRSSIAEILENVQPIVEEPVIDPIKEPVEPAPETP